MIETISDLYQEIMKKPLGNMFYYAEAQSLAFHSALRSMGILVKHIDLSQPPTYEPDVADELSNLELQVEQETRNYQEAPEELPKEFRERWEKLQEYASIIAKYRLRFKEDSNIDVLLVEGGINSFNIERMLPKRVLTLHHETFYFRSRVLTWSYDEHARIFLPTYNKVKELEIADYVLIPETRYLLHAPESIIVKMYERKDPEDI